MARVHIAVIVTSAVAQRVPLRRTVSSNRRRIRAPPLRNAAYAPRTHWRQAKQLLPRGRAEAAGDGVIDEGQRAAIAGRLAARLPG